MGALQALQNHKPFLVKPGANPGISEIIAEKTSTQSVVSEDVTTGRLNLTESIRNESWNSLNKDLEDSYISNDSGKSNSFDISLKDYLNCITDLNPKFAFQMDRFNNKNHVGFFDMLDLGQENGEIPEDCLELDL